MSLRYLPAIAVPVALGVAACGTGAVPPDDLEKSVAAELKTKIGVSPKKVDCPEGLDAETGAKATCVLTAPNGDRYDIELTATDVKGSDVNFTFKVGDTAK
ncbi:MAG: DUF4333 domain-containing protein [Solirubrobacteraceae bacterium]|nr:DUF4333 domain-containing protein [Solirubrobacteraceae bacterium]